MLICLQQPRQLRREVRGIDRELQRGQPEHRRTIPGMTHPEPQPERRAAASRPENMTVEELVILDIFTRLAPELSTEERAEVKKVARELLNRLKTLLVLNWRQKSSARSQLKRREIASIFVRRLSRGSLS